MLVHMCIIPGWLCVFIDDGQAVVLPGLVDGVHAEADGRQQGTGQLHRRVLSRARDHRDGRRLEHIRPILQSSQ